ncbi:MAG: GAF domain-containing protein [Anaerolineales bacterium]|nr:GAF domain-containing protein [Anaerolineales bacterium]
MQPAVYWLILFLALAGLAALLLRRWQSRRALVRRLGELSALAEIGRALSSAPLDLPRLAEAVRVQAAQIVPAESFQLGLFEDDRYRLLLWIVNGERRPPAQFRLTSAGLGILGWVRDNRQSLLVRDFEREAHTLPAQPSYSAPQPPRSAVFVPLLAGGHALGALALQCPQPNAFTEAHVRLLNIVANHAAAAVEHARLYEQSQRRATQLELVASVAQRVNVLQPLPQLTRQVVELVAEAFTGLVVSFYEAEGETLRLRATAPSGARLPAPSGAAPPTPPVLPGVVALGEGLVGRAAQTCQALSHNELPELVEAPGVGLRPGRAELAVPVEIDARVLGVLHAYHDGGALIDDSAPAVFQSLAAQMALAILEAQVYAAEQRRADQFAALAQASRTVTSSLELDDMLDEVLDVVDDRFGYKAARIFLLHDDRLVFQAGIGVGTVGHTIEGLAYDLDGPGLIALAGRTRQLLRVDDVSAHPAYLPGPGLAATSSELAAPLVMGARLLGVFDVQSDRLGAFSEEDARTVQALADTLAVAVRNARLFEFERRRRHLAEIMREVSAALTATLQLDSVLELILDGLALVVPYDAASILLANDAGQMVLRATRGAPGAEEALGRPLAVRTFQPGETVPAALPFHEVDLDHAYHHLLALPEPHACLGAPLAPGGAHAGYLVVDCAGQKRFQPGEVDLVAAFASQAAVAIENARLYTAQREQAWISTALLQVADATARTTELDDVLATVSRLTPLLVGVDRCAILMAAGERWRLAAYAAGDDAANAAETLAGVRTRFPDGLAADGWARFDDLLARREPVVLEPEDDLPLGLRELFIGVVILLPLLAKGRVEGVMVVGQVPGETPFTAHRVRLLGGIANQAALAIESALLLAAQQEEAWVTTALLQVAESVAGQPLEQGLETASRLTPILVGIDKLAVYQYDAPAGAFRLRQVAGLERPADSAAAALNISLGDLGLLADDPLFASEVPWRLRVPPQLLAWFGAPDCFVWPLRANGEVLGALVVEANELMGRRLTIMNGIAYQLAMAMENARLAREVAQQERLERELEVGRDIQASFLPQTYPQADGWQITAFWHSARQVGGDFYDFIALAPGENGPRWGIVIADVADKGVPAALFMALSRTLLRTVAINRIWPAETLGRVNELILSDSRSEQFVTVFYGVWEPGTGRLTYAVGGHNPPVWARADGLVQALPGRGIALGVLDGARYTAQQVVLAPGEALLLYTDGLTDAVNHLNEEFGVERVFAVMRAAPAASAEVILGTLAAAVQGHVGAREPFDDMTMVVLKRAH